MAVPTAPPDCLARSTTTVSPPPSAPTRPRVGQPTYCVLAATLSLLALGLIMVYSTSGTDGLTLIQGTAILRRQLLWAALALIALVLTWQTDIDLLRRLRWPILLGTVLLLVAVLIPGIGYRPEGRGAVRWIRLGSFTFQPSELAKLGLLIWLAGEIQARKGKLTSFKEGFLPLFGVTGLVAGLVALEPDFGTSIFIVMMATAVLFVAGLRLRHMVAVALPLALVGGIFMFNRFDHIQERVDVFLHPEADLSGKGYQVRQGLVALGSGGPFGQGLGASRQKLRFLPDEHTDFIFAILGEELGLVGALCVIILFGILLVAAFRIALRAPDPFRFHLGIGVAFMITLQAILNLAVVTGSMPAKGIPLPFLSYGGTSLLISMVGVGLILSISRRRTIKVRVASTEETGGAFPVVPSP